MPLRLIKIEPIFLGRQAPVLLTFFTLAQQPLVVQGLLIVEGSRSHSDTPQTVGFFWTSDQSAAQTST